jgi:adenylylsulfate kinase
MKIKQKSKNIRWHEHKVTRNDREKLLGQKGVVLWFTGLSGSGKSTIANNVAYELYKMNKLAYVLDGDNIRHGLNRNLGFSKVDRDENIRRICEVSKLFADAGVITCTAFISPYKKMRGFCRDIVGSKRFFEVYCKASLQTCEKRDPKGLYKKARGGKVKEFTGISAPYEEPDNPDVIIDTDKYDIKESVEIIINMLKKEKII